MVALYSLQHQQGCDSNNDGRRRINDAGSNGDKGGAGGKVGHAGRNDRAPQIHFETNSRHSAFRVWTWIRIVVNRISTNVTTSFYLEIQYCITGIEKIVGSAK